MHLKYILFLLLILSGFKVRSQILLNEDSTQIRKAVVSNGALAKISVEKDVEMKGNYLKMIFRFPSPPEGNSCLMGMTFYLTVQNKCFKYYEDYWGKDIADQRIVEFNLPSYGLKPVAGGLKWVNSNKGFMARLIPKKAGNNKFDSVYILEFEKLSLKAR